jgi:hypothetical protein
VKNLAPLALLMIAFLLIGCYSFRGISIPPTANTYYVELFGVEASAAPATMGQDFTRELTDKIRNESRLKLDDLEPDLLFSGTVSKFEVTAINPEPNARVGSNRLTIDIRVSYKELEDPDADWQQTFSYFVDFPSDRNLLDLQDQLVQEAYDQITEDIFNKAFTDW